MDKIILKDFWSQILYRVGQEAEEELENAKKMTVIPNEVIISDLTPGGRQIVSNGTSPKQSEHDYSCLYSWYEKIN